jgi:hypothetical protein
MGKNPNYACCHARGRSNGLPDMRYSDSNGGDTCGKQTDFNDSTPDTPIFNEIILILKRFHPGGFNNVMYK